MKVFMRGLMQDLVDKTYMINGREQTVRSVQVVDNVYHIVTDFTGYKVQAKDARRFLNENVLEIEKPKSELMHLPISLDVTTNVMNVLSDSLTRLSKDANFAQQAKAINSTINTMMGVVKTAIMVEKFKNA